MVVVVVGHLPEGGHRVRVFSRSLESESQRGRGSGETQYCAPETIHPGAVPIHAIRTMLMLESQVAGMDRMDVVAAQAFTLCISRMPPVWEVVQSTTH